MMTVPPARAFWFPLILAGTLVQALPVHSAEIPLNDPIVLEARTLRDRGEFAQATRKLQQHLDQTTTLSQELQRALRFEIEKIRRSRIDYSLSREALLKALQRRISNFQTNELEQAIKDGHLDRLVIDGEERFVSASVSNLILRQPQLRQRLNEPPTRENSFYVRLLDAVEDALQAGEKNPNDLPHVLPRDWQATVTITLAPDKVPAGQLVRAWLPFPQELPSQTQVALLSSDPPGGFIAPPDTPQRSIYLERMAVAETTTTFQASYRFTTFARLHSPQESQVLPYPTGSAQPWRDHLASRPPHLDLSDEKLREQAQTIIGFTTNPLAKVRAIHQWMIENQIYQFAREYSTLDSLSRYTLDRGAGDCGQHAMLFIALCRIAGIPARWASGWDMYEERAGMHDWTEVWIEPYGWIPVDTDLALMTKHHQDGFLTPQDIQKISEFMVGNSDGRRLTINVDYGRPFVPTKTDFRSEPLDFQRGEVEANGKNLYFNEWNSRMEIQEIQPNPTPTPRRQIRRNGTR